MCQCEDAGVGTRPIAPMAARSWLPMQAATLPCRSARSRTMSRQRRESGPRSRKSPTKTIQRSSEPVPRRRRARSRSSRPPRRGGRRRRPAGRRSPGQACSRLDIPRPCSSVPRASNGHGGDPSLTSWPSASSASVLTSRAGSSARSASPGLWASSESTSALLPVPGAQVQLQAQLADSRDQGPAPASHFGHRRQRPHPGLGERLDVRRPWGRGPSGRASGSSLANSLARPTPRMPRMVRSASPPSSSLANRRK